MKAIKLHSPLGTRGTVVIAIFASAIIAFIAIGLDIRNLIPTKGGLQIMLDFFSRAFSPALSYESSTVPSDAPPLILKSLEAARNTVIFAAAAMSLALVIGFILGFPSSSAWWEGDPVGGRTLLRKIFASTVAPSIHLFSRLLIAFMRSIHEILWAVLFLAAFGINTFSAVLAITIPFGGTLAKIFSEMIDEAPRNSAIALRGLGASPLQVFFFGLLPRALPDMLSYAFYRFECSVRSSAVLGFFGFQTLGYFISSSFVNLHYGEVWTYLYTLFILIVVIDIWSGALRKRFVA